MKVKKRLKLDFCPFQTFLSYFLYSITLDEHHYTFLLPIMKCLIEKCYNLLQMNVQVPNIPLGSNSPNFYEDFKEYCKTSEWRIFIQKQVKYLKTKEIFKN
jgi:hypothetical protein